MGIGIWQVVLILVVVLIIFGAGKLPRVMGDVAKGVKNFKAGMADEVTDGNKEQAPASNEQQAQAVDANSKEGTSGG